jgi:hypothetical protein
MDSRYQNPVHRSIGNASCMLLVLTADSNASCMLLVLTADSNKHGPLELFL